MFVSVYPADVHAEIRRLVAAGLGIREVGRRMDVHHSTVAKIRDREESRLCPRCWQRTTPIAGSAADHAELLGFYLGDGCISRLARTCSLRISMDAKYPGLVRRVVDLVQRCFPGRPVAEVDQKGTAVVVNVYHSHLPCVFPQHGPGKKHDRPITLESWQEELVAEAPWSLIRGLLLSDGCVFLNRHGSYVDLSYAFSNHSQDILELLTRTSEAVGMHPRQTKFAVRFNRREDVHLLLSHVGIKR